MISRIAHALGLIAALVSLGVSAVSAQEPWEGDESLLVVVTDERGQAVPGVLVVLLYGEEGLRGPVLTTGGDGRAQVEGLAAGEWQVDLRRESFMLSTTYLRLEPGGDPEVGFSSRQRTGSYWAPLSAVFLPPGAEVTGAVAAGTRTPKQARKQRQREERTAAKEAERQARRYRKGRTARVVDPLVPARADEDQVSRAPRVGLPAAGPGLTANPDLLPEGACRECREGEWSVSSSVRVMAANEAGAESCPEPRWPELVEAIAPSWTGSLTNFAGAYAEDDLGALTLLEEPERSALLARFDGWFPPEASCSAVAVLLPAGSRYVGFRYQAGERATVAECLPGKDCQVGEATFVGEPAVLEDDSFVLVGAVFENRSQARARVGRLTVYFAPPPGWLPAN